MKPKDCHRVEEENEGGSCREARAHRILPADGLALLHALFTISLLLLLPLPLFCWTSSSYIRQPSAALYTSFPNLITTCQAPFVLRSRHPFLRL